VTRLPRLLCAGTVLAPCWLVKAQTASDPIVTFSKPLVLQDERKGLISYGLHSLLSSIVNALKIFLRTLQLSIICFPLLISAPFARYRGGEELDRWFDLLTRYSMPT